MHMPYDSPSREPAPRVPSYRRHKPTGQAVVTLNGHDIYLGKYGAKASRAEYDRLTGEWLAAGRCLPRPESDLTVAELAQRYWQFAKGYYRKDGQPTGHVQAIRQALRPLRETYAFTLAADFGPLALRAVQQKLVGAGNARSYVNHLCAIVKRAFKWAVSQELLPEPVYRALATVPGLKQGRTEAREPERVPPVVESVVEATLPHLPPAVADMVRIQRLTGCRPGEVCAMRPCDLDRSGDVWIYRPASHKTQHHGRERLIFIGPKAQAILLPYLLRDAESYCFSPRESRHKQCAEMRAKRKTKVQPSQLNRCKRHPKREPGDRYVKDAYCRAIHRAIDQANAKRQSEAEEQGRKIDDNDNLSHWHPNQLRHAAATEIRRQFGLEAAQTVLGHAKADVTQVYAERDWSLAAEIMRKIG